MPVLVWIKGEEPIYKVYHTVGKSKHIWVGAKRQCWHYTKHNTTYCLGERLAGVVCVVFQHFQCPSARGEGIMGHCEVVQKGSYPQINCVHVNEIGGGKRNIHDGDNRLMKK